MDATKYCPPSLRGYKMGQKDGDEFVRVVSKVNHGRGMSKRVLVVSRIGLVLCEHGSSQRLVKRFYAPEELKEAVLYTSNNLLHLLVRAKYPEPDALLVFDNQPANGKDSTRDHAEAALEAFGKMNPPVPVQRDPPVPPHPNLVKGPGFTKPKQKMETMKQNRSHRPQYRPMPPQPPLEPQPGSPHPNSPPPPPPPADAIPQPGHGQHPQPQPGHPQPPQGHTGQRTHESGLGQPFEVSLMHLNEFLGLEYSELPSGVVIVERATAGTPCGRANVIPGRLTAVNGQRLRSPGDFSALVSKHKAAAKARGEDEVHFLLHVQETDPSVIEAAQQSRELHNKLLDVREQEGKLEMWQWNLDNRDRALQELEEAGRTIDRARSEAQQKEDAEDAAFRDKVRSRGPDSHRLPSEAASTRDGGRSGEIPLSRTSLRAAQVKEVQRASPEALSDGFIGELFDTLPSLPTDDGEGEPERGHYDYEVSLISPARSVHTFVPSSTPLPPFRPQDHTSGSVIRTVTYASSESPQLLYHVFL